MEVIDKICKKCGKKIQGLSQGQVEYLMEQHNMAKHKEKEG